jgi:hypothetical protein
VIAVCSAHTECLDRNGESGKDDLFGTKHVPKVRKNRIVLRGKWLGGAESAGEVDKQRARRLSE